MQKKQFKVLAEIPRFNGDGTYMKEIGNAFGNKDDSINAFLEMIPLAALGAKGGLKLHIRELDARDLEKRAAYRAQSTGRVIEPSGGASAASEGLPF